MITTQRVAYSWQAEDCRIVRAFEMMAVGIYVCQLSLNVHASRLQQKRAILVPWVLVGLLESPSFARSSRDSATGSSSSSAQKVRLGGVRALWAVSAPDCFGEKRPLFLLYSGIRMGTVINTSVYKLRGCTVTDSPSRDYID